MERHLALPPNTSDKFSDAYLLRAIVHERLGQLYEAKGDTAKAVNNHRTFSAGMHGTKSGDPLAMPVPFAKCGCALLTSK